MYIDFANKVILITGGTRGIGLKSALRFAENGAQCILTYAWGDHNEAEICKQFQKCNGPKPLIVQADVSKRQDTSSLMQTISSKYNSIDIFISNASVSMLTKSFEDYSLSALKKSISYSAWPMVDYSKQIYSTFGKYPKYIIGVSSTGPEHYYYGYDFVATSKTVLEILCRYMNQRLSEHGVIVNTIRSRAIKTQSLVQTFGLELESLVKKLIPDNYWIEIDDVAKAIIGLCSGYSDSIRGQTITVDKGTSFFDNFMDIYTRYKKGELKLELIYE